MVRIRALEAGDLPAVERIWNQVIRDTAVTFTTVEKTPEWLEGWLAGDGPRLAAEADGALVGFASAGRFRDGPGYAFTWEHSLHVAEDARGRGAGRALMEAVLAELKARDARSCIAGVSGANAAALAFHDRLGFHEVGRVRDAGFKFGRWLDLVLMQRML